MSSPSGDSVASGGSGGNSPSNKPETLINTLIDKTKRRSGSNPPTPSGSPTMSRLSNASEHSNNCNNSNVPSPKLPTSPNNANLEGIYRKFVKLKKNISGNPSYLNLKGDTDDNILSPLRMTWSDFESEYEKEYINIPDLLKFPIDEIMIKRKERTPRTIFSPTIGLVQGNLDYYVRDIIDNFYKDYLIVEHKSTPSDLVLSGQRKLSNQHKSVNYSSLESLKLENNGIARSNSMKDSLDDDDSLNGSSGNIVVKTRLFHTGKQLTRGSSFGSTILDLNSNLYQKPTISNNNDLLKEYIPEKFGLELLCEVKELKFSLEIEPFFCSLYIIDLGKKERITECFNFHLNSKQLLDSLKMNENLSNIMSNQKQCIFSLNNYHPNMYFLLRVYHIFRGDVEKDIKHYFKSNKPSAISQFKSEIIEKCIGVDNKDTILQPFLWGVYPVFHRPTLTQTGSSLNLLSNTSGNSNNNNISISSNQQISTKENSIISPNLNSTPPIITIQPSTIPIINLTTSPQNSNVISPNLNSSIPTPPPPPPIPPLSPLSQTSRRRSSFLTSHTVSSSQLTSPNLLMNKITNNIEIVNLIPATPNLSDRAICEILQSDKELKKLKPIPGSFVMSIKTITESDNEEIRGRLTPSLVPAIPISRESPPHFIREIQDFSEALYPFMEYVNNIYIYPENAYIKVSNPNIQVEIKLVDDLSSSKAMACVYPNTPPTIPQKIWENINQPAPGKPGPSPTTPYPFLESYAYSGVTFHDKRPLFTEEFKIKLPAKITTHYVVFTFYNINQSSKKDSKSIVGYAAIPLFGSNSCLSDGSYTFSIETNEHVESIRLNTDEQKKEKNSVFTFRIKLISSLISQDSNLDLFFKEQHNVNKQLDAVKAVSKIDRVPCVKFFPAILNQLFQIMCSSANDVASQAFASILIVIKMVDGFQEKKPNNEKSRLLTLYSEYLFDYVPDSKHLYEELCRHWVNSGSSVKDFRLNWFLLDIMTKSMALSLQPTGKLDSDLGRENRFKIEFQENLNKLVLKLIPLNNSTTNNINNNNSNQSTLLIQQQSSTNSSSSTNPESLILVQFWEFFTFRFPLFINNLFPLIDRGFLYHLIYSYIARFNQSNDDVTLVTVRFNFLKVITDYDHYIPLNFPVTYKSIEPISDLPIKFFKRHFLSSLVINEVESSITLAKPIRNQAIITLKQLLKKHHYDPRYQDQEIRERIATMYFPFIVKIIDHHSIIRHQLEPQEVKDWLTCFIWILQYCSRELLVNWFLKETPSHQETFLRILLMLLDVFKSEPSIYEITMLCIEISKIFLNHLNEDLIQSNTLLLDNIITILQISSSISGVEMIKFIQSLIRDYLIPKYPISLFHSLTNSYCEILSHEILKSISIPELIDESSSLFYQLLVSNFESTKDITKMKIQSTVAISRLVVEIKLENSSRNLTLFLEKVMNLCKNNSNVIKLSNSSLSFIDQVEEMINRISTIIKYSNNINANKNDPEMVAEMYYRISNSYYESPNLRLTWLENLSTIHIENEQFDEASQCLVHCAHLISRYLVQSGKFMDILESDFQSICPNLKKELVLPEFDQKDQGALFQTQIWTLDNVVQLLEQAISLLNKCNRYELAIETYSLISKILKAKKSYSQLIQCLSNSKQICETLIEKSKDSRVFSRYYRVGFYGKKLEDLDGKEYIYKKPHSVGISAIQAKLTSNLQEKFGSDQKIELLSNIKVEETTLLPNTIYLQIVSVEPYIENSNAEIGISQFDQYFNLTCFISEVAFSQEGKVQAELIKQQKKKTIFSVDLAFPYVKNRIEIKSKKEIILSPIENAIELIQARCIKLKEHLDTNTPRVNPLQQIIQGSVFPMVNDGPLKVCEIFLNKKTISQFNPEHVDQLKKAMDRFLIYCGFAIKLSKSIMSHKHQDFQNMVQNQYEILKNQISAYIK